MYADSLNFTQGASEIRKTESEIYKAETEVYAAWY